jgi:uncharacterized coiled-coil protein SlyX
LISQQEIDRNLQEATGYHKLLIDQVQTLETRLEGLTVQLGQQAQVLKETSQGMVDAMKECLDLMHKTRILDGLTPLGTESDSVLAVIPKNAENRPPEHLSVPVAKLDKLVEPSKQTDEINAEVQQIGNDLLDGSEQGKDLEVLKSSKLDSHSVSPLVTLPVYEEGEPFASYSSDEDPEFFDANDIIEEDGPRRESILTEQPDVSQPSHTLSRTASQEQVQADSDSDEDTDGSGGADKSVISHLLSQVRIGMDLTRITLPTFILERRSLLEMYADFFAHPDIFVSVVDLPDPKDRMICVVKWYLSAFHAGRKSAIAKKPYNPILGEIFQCYWDLTECSPSDVQRPELMETGPVPWAASTSVTFIAEQVSHHPPISAFYAEDVSRNIQVNAHIYTKSKFLGLAIGVHNIGEATLSLLDQDEHYRVTFPNGYGRSILTVPWVELGGKVMISCPETGYSAPIEFHCKVFLVQFTVLARLLFMYIHGPL